MKTLLLFLGLALNASAQINWPTNPIPNVTLPGRSLGLSDYTKRVAFRPWVDTKSNLTYVVRWEYDSSKASVPLTLPGGQPHYQATVTVTLNGKQIGEAFPGEYTPNGCFEDEPETMVAKALASVKTTGSATNNVESLLFIERRITNYTNRVEVSPDVYCQVPSWLMSTNWSPLSSEGYLLNLGGGADTVYAEYGTVTSNLVMRVVYKGTAKEVTLESHTAPFLVNRRYKIKRTETREYQ